MRMKDTINIALSYFTMNYVSTAAEKIALSRKKATFTVNYPSRVRVATAGIERVTRAFGRGSELRKPARPTD